jgi:hypothetical protein
MTRVNERSWWLISAVALLAACSIPVESIQSPTELSERHARDWQAIASSFQVEILRDGYVTPAEYMTAMQAGAACMTDRGFDVSPLRDVPDGVRKDFTVALGSRQEDEITPMWAECRKGFYGAVESVWLAQHSRLDEGLATLEAELIECLRAAGIPDVEPGLEDYELFLLLRNRDASAAAWICRERFLIFTGQALAKPQ